MHSVEKERKKLEANKKTLEQKGKLPTFNCHSHIFNLDHVHDRFIKRMFSVRFIFLGLALLLIVAEVILLLLQVLLGIWPLQVLLLDPAVHGIILSVILLLLLLFLVFKRVFITIRIKRLTRNKFIRRVTRFLDRIIPVRYDILERMASFVKHSYDTESNRMKTQEEIFDQLTSYYSNRTKFVVLTMDLDYMINGKPPRKPDYMDQLSKIEEIKEKKDEQGEYVYKHRIYPFIHADPRRLEEDPMYYPLLEEYIKDRIFQGIKIYPALGYFPFDRRLKPVYDLAIEYDLPIMTHCAVGPVFYRGKPHTLKKEPYYNIDYCEKKGTFTHPFTCNVLQGRTPRQFTPHFTHPLNYYCLMYKPERLAEYWNKTRKSDQPEVDADELKKYRNLKICLGHFGGSDQWIKYLKDPWLPSDRMSIEDIFQSWKHYANGKEPKHSRIHSWHTIIYDMLTAKDEDDKDKLMFPNLYADISFNVSEEQTLPLLKIRLETSRTLREKILFGTDFYMVSYKGSEREITMKLRSFIGEEHFKQIAKLNPLKFLFTKWTLGDELLQLS